MQGRSAVYDTEALSMTAFFPDNLPPPLWSLSLPNPSAAWLPLLHPFKLQLLPQPSSHGPTLVCVQQILVTSTRKNIFFLEKQKEISFTLKSTVAFPRRHLTSIWELNRFDKLFCFVFLLNVDEELSDFCISKHLYFKRSCKATTCAQSDEPLQLPSNAASVFLLHVLNVRFLFCSVCYSNRAPRENRGFWQVFFFLRSS